MPIRGGLAGAPNTVACFIETPGGGDWRDIDAPRNAPMKNPMNHLDKVIWHTDFFQYELVVGIMDITVNHAALAVAPGPSPLVARTWCSSTSSATLGQLT